MGTFQVGLLLIGTFALLLALSVPVSVSIIISSVVTMASTLSLDLGTFVASQRMVGGVDSFSLLAVPFYILCGVLMNTGGIAQKLIDFAKILVGRIPGGLAHTNILGNTLFGSLSGSSVAASVAIGGVLIPMEEKEGYDKKFAAAVNIASAPTGLIIPPSGILIIYPVLAGCSVVGMIMSGYIPGLMWALACMVVAYVIAKKNHYPTAGKVPASVFFKYFVDAIDPDHSTNVRIIGCHVQCADDCICLKTTAGNDEYGPTKNVIISNCTLTSTSAAIKIGTEGVADFENILVDNCIITGTNRGLSIQIRDGGCVRNVSFSNIMIETRRFAECWWGCAEPIVMTTHDRNANTHSGSIENVRFFNVTCKGENGVFLSGNEENHIKNVLFENVSVCLEATSKWERGMYDLRPIPPEKEGMLHQKSAAVFLRWVDGVTIRNSTLGFAGEDRSDFAQGLLTQNCTSVQTMGLTAEAATPEYESVQLG